MERPITIELDGWCSWINSELQPPLPPMELVTARDWLVDWINSSAWELRRLETIRICQYLATTRYNYPKEKRSRDPFSMDIPAPFPWPWADESVATMPHSFRVEWVPLSRKIGGPVAFKPAPTYAAHAVQFPQASCHAFRATYVADKNVAAGLARELEFQGTQLATFATFRDVELLTTNRFITIATPGEYVVFETAWWLWHFLKQTHQLRGRTTKAAHSVFAFETMGNFRASLKPRRGRGRFPRPQRAVRSPDGRWQRIQDKGEHRAPDGKFQKR